MQFTYIGSQSKKDVRLASSIANGAFVTANSASLFANGAFSAANSASLYANAAFAAANSGSSSSFAFDQANAAFGAANSASLYANGAFSQANLAYDAIITSSNTASLYYLTRTFTGDGSTTAFTVTANTTSNSILVFDNGITQNPIVDYSVTGTTLTFTTAPSTGSVIQVRELLSNVPVVTDNSNSAFDRANAAFAAANSGSSASFAFAQANAAFIQANAVFSQSNNQVWPQANAAFSVANSASNFANGAFTKANSANVLAQSAFDAANSASSFANGAFTAANLKFNSTGGTISGDVSITGNLSVTGNTFSTSATQIVANDTLFIMGTGNYSGDVLDIGFAAHYNNGTNAHTGLIRDASTKEWQLFEEYTPEVGSNNNIIITDGSFKLATLNANLKSTTITIKGIDLLPYVNNAFDKANSSASFANGAFVQANSNYTSAVTKLAVTTPGMYYSIDQYSGNNPTIYIRAGETIAFDLDVSGHPFMIRVSSGGSNYNTGLIHVDTDGTLTTGSSAQGKITGTLYWKVPYDIVGSTYVYQCSVHSGMVGNIVIDQPTAIAFTQANNAYDKANSAGSFANGAFDAANSAASFANASFITANSSYNSQNITAGFANGAFAHANAAFNQANTGGSDAWVRTQANNAYDTANSGAIFANGAFTAANTADSKATSSGLFANAAFDRANAAFIAANTGGGGPGTPVSIYSDRFTANGATTTFTLSTSPTNENYIIAVVDGITQFKDTYAVSGNVVTFDSTFENGANVEVTTITGGGAIDPYAANTANLAYAQANAAFNQANTGGSDAWVRTQANNAYDKANSGATFANGAFLTANSGAVFANAAFITANAAFAAANAGGGADTYARTTANAAFIQANAAFTQANTGGTSLSKAIAMSIVFGF